MRKSITVTTDCQDAKIINLSFQFPIETMITVLPRPNLFSQFIVGDGKTERLLLHRNDGNKLEVSEVRYESDAIDITVKPVNPDAKAPAGFKNPGPGDVWLIARAKNDAEPGHHSTKVWLTTNHPEMPELQVPVSFRIRPEISVYPQEVRLWVQRGGQGPKGTVFRLNHNRGTAFTIKEIRVEDPELLTAVEIAPKPDRMANIRLDVPDDFPYDSLGTAGKKTEIVVVTSEPEAREIRVPVTIMEHRAPAGRRSGGVADLRPVDIQRRGLTRPAPTPLPTGTPKAGSR